MSSAHMLLRATTEGLACISDPAQRALLARYLDGALSGEMTLMYWLKAVPDIDAVCHQLGEAIRDYPHVGSLGAAGHSLKSLSALVERNYEGCDRIARMLRSGIDSDQPARSVAEGIAFCRTLFDWSVEQSAESSVALYSFANAQILDAATTEIVDLLRHWQVVGPDRDLLEIGCGIGRFQKALSAEVKSVTGIDVSPNMIAAARDRCTGLLNVTLLECSGLDLASFGDGCCDLVFAVDSFPYLYQSGMQLVETHFTEARRVLRRGGNFVILEFSYRGNIDLDRVDVHRLAASSGFEVRVSGTQPFSLWDGAAFHLASKQSL
jgi:hypothetical protein